METKRGGKRLSIGCIVVFPREGKKYIAQVTDIDYSAAKKAKIVVVLEMSFSQPKNRIKTFIPSNGRLSCSVSIEEIERIDQGLRKRLLGFVRGLSLDPANEALARSLFPEDVFR